MKLVKQDNKKRRGIASTHAALRLNRRHGIDADQLAPALDFIKFQVLNGHAVLLHHDDKGNGVYVVQVADRPTVVVFDHDSGHVVTVLPDCALDNHQVVWTEELVDRIDALMRTNFGELKSESAQ
jgi:hypothetical protein